MSNIHVRLVEAVGLAATDLLGFADPYCKVHLQNITEVSDASVFKSESKKKSTDPIFDCACSLKLGRKDLDDGQLIIDIYDYDKAKKNDDVLGQATLPLSYFKDKERFAGWLPVRSAFKDSKKNKKKNSSSKELHKKDNKPLSPSQNNYQSRAKQIESNRAKTPDIILNGSSDLDSAPPDFYHNKPPPPKLPTSPPVNSNDKLKQLGDISSLFTMKANDVIDDDNAGFAINFDVDNNDDDDDDDDGDGDDEFKKRDNKLAETEYTIVREETALNEQVANKMKIGAEHGRRNRESGRLYIVVYYPSKKYNFGGKKDVEDTNKERKRNLLISHADNVITDIPINVFTLTFNCGNCPLSELNESFKQWLPNNNYYDLFALGFQECNEGKDKDKDKNNKDNNNDEKENDDLNQQEMVEAYLLNYFGPNYVSISNYKMWQTRIYIISKREYKYLISNVTSHFHKTGFGGIGKNKGGVGISLDFDGLSLCFISCHLAAHQTQTDGRNTMYRKICKNIKIGWPKQQILGQFHYIFFMGDMNYRINYFGKKHPDKPKHVEFQQVCSIIKEISTATNKNKQQEHQQQQINDKGITGGGKLKLSSTPYSGLLQYDQLNLSKTEQKAFYSFNEHHIKFPPSFKVKRQSGLHYKSQRLPAWCDRILFKCPSSYSFAREYKVYNYRMYDRVSVSDHKPVSCSFILNAWSRPVGISDECTKSIIHFKNCKANNLIAADVNGKSDPYIHFPRQLLLEKFAKSKRVNKTLNPEWKDKNLPNLTLIRNSLPFLEKALLLFQIRDWDRVTANDLIAVGYIELKNNVNHLNEWCKFKEIMTLDGKPAGSIEGQIKLEYKVKKKKK